MNLDQLLAQANTQIIFIINLKSKCTPSQKIYFEQALIQSIQLADWLQHAKDEENVQ